MSAMKEERLIEIGPADVTVLFATEAELHGKINLYRHDDETQGRQGGKGLWAEGWTTLDDYLAWNVEVLEEGDYSVCLSYSCVIDPGGSEYEVVAGDCRVGGTVRETTGWLPSFFTWTSFERQQIEGTLHLSRGVRTIEIRATKKPGTGEVMRLYSLDLTPLPAQEKMTDAGERARRIRASTDWFVAAKYGVMFHWGTRTQPRRGPQKAFPDAVSDFDVDNLADIVQQTGAGYVIFQAVHGSHWFPGPIQSIEKIMPGRTCQRDLIGDLADALNARGIRLVLYHAYGGSEKAWAKASGYDRKDKSEFHHNLCTTLTEIGERYGNKVAGYWFDFCPFNVSHHFEPLFVAAKAGNADRIVAWNSWIVRKPSDFQEYWAGELGGALILPNAEHFGDLQPHVLLYLDGGWSHRLPDTDIPAPLFFTHTLVDYVKACIARKVVVSLNLYIYQDGAVSPATLEQLQVLRREIRGESKQSV